MDVWAFVKDLAKGAGRLATAWRRWGQEDRAEIEAAHEKEIQILRDRLSRGMDETDRAEIERDLREAEDRYIQHLRDKIVAISKGVVRDRTPTRLITIEASHLPPAEGAALARAASTWAGLEPPKTFEDRLALGNAFHMAGDFERSLAEYDAALLLRPEDPQGLAERGMILLHLGRKQEALEAFQQSLARRPDDPDALSGLGDALGNLGRRQEALTQYNRFLDLHPDDPDVLNNRGVTLGRLHRYEEALADFNRALELRPADPHLLGNRGNALDEAGWHEGALADYNRSLALRPDDPATFYNRGIALGHLHRHDEALADYTRSLELRPDDPNTLSNRGFTLHHLERYQEALADLNHSLELRPDHPATMYSTACLYSLCSRYDDSLRWLEKAIAGDATYRARAAKDEGFAGLRADPEFGPRFQKLVEGQTA